ncbi:MAG: TetR/AcrR family transcriptional regulator, regulator of autoinduction and epiphytic fitness [Frankiaceae bacterium]|nr:TetR/AcrR family transcriptional regulator, regulator of autoinduction and epiphytic fitness [Frankiaceae bacterium]
MASIQGAEAVDGRLARSARTRLAIVDALRSLHHEGDLLPTAPRVAERAGVSVRTVWQHFDDLEMLFVEAGRRDLEIALTFVTPIDAGLPLAARVDALVDQRSRMYEEMAPVWRAARLKAPFSPQIRLNRDRMVRLGREQLERLFAAELAATPEPAALLASLEIATGWAAWESLRTELALDVPAARAAVELTVRRLTT